MKKILHLFLILLMLICAGCDSSDSEISTNESENEASSVDIEPYGDILVVYFSQTGHTEPLAKYAKEYLGADIYKIEAKIPYTDADINYNNSNSRANREQNDSKARPEIANPISDISSYDTIILGYPIWWGQAPKIIYTFLESMDFSNKYIIPFCTSASSGLGSSATNLHSAVDSSVRWNDGKRFEIGTSKEVFTNWLSSLNIKKSIENNMKLFIGDIEVPVIWENNKAVLELMSDSNTGITVNMRQYGGFEQVGSLPKSYSSNDERITTSCGDIVLYSDNNIVLFYGSNTWEYTRLGKINLSNDEIINLLNASNITIALK